MLCALHTTTQHAFSTTVTSAGYTQAAALVQKEGSLSMTQGTLTRDLQRTRANSPVLIDGVPQSLTAEGWSNQLLAAQNASAIAQQGAMEMALGRHEPRVFSLLGSSLS